MSLVKLSSSAMDLYNEWCQRKYRLQYIEKIKVTIESIALVFGKDFHKSIQNFYDKYRLDLSNYIYEINNYYKEEIKNCKLNGNTKVEFQICFSNFINIQIKRINNYINKFGMDKEKIDKLFYPIIIEKKYTIPINRNIEFTGVIDSAFFTEDGVFILDWKSDKDCSNKSFLKHVPQLNRYSRLVSVDKFSCSKFGIFFLRESLLYKDKPDLTYSLENECEEFVTKLSKSNFEKVSKSNKWRCFSEKGRYECAYFTMGICDGWK